MSISAYEAVLLLQGLPYLIFVIITARQFLRSPGALSAHAALLFASATTALLLTEVRLWLFGSGAQDTTAFFLLRLSVVGNLLSVYAVFLLVTDVTNIRRWLGWVAPGLLFLSSGFTLLLPENLARSLFFPDVPVPFRACVIFPYLLVSYILIAIWLWYSSALSSGAIRYRLQWLAASATLAGFGTSLALARLFAPEHQLLITWIERLLLLLTGIALYLGCAPPAWLRHFWVLPELERVNQFCATLMFRLPEVGVDGDTSDQRAAIIHILRSAMTGLGAFAGTVKLWNEQAGALELAASILPSEDDAAIAAKSINDALLLEVFQSRQALLRHLSGRRCPFLRRRFDAGAMLIVPLIHEEQTPGVIGLCCAHAASINGSDLARLQLFANQLTWLVLSRAQRQQAAALRKEQRLKDEFMALIAHDLRTPLTVLRGRLQLLRRQLLKEGLEEEAAMVAKLDAPSSRMSQLTATLLDVSYIDSGRLQLLRHPVDLMGLVRKATEASTEGAIALEIVDAVCREAYMEGGSYQPFIVLGDAGRLEQVLEHLLENARKYSPTGSRITVRLECRAGGEEALLSVRDHGQGIPPEDQPRLFERWYHPANSPFQGYAGSELGLYMSHEIITRHGGRLWVESSGIPGEGATFFFTLPLIHNQQAEDADSSSTE